MIVKLQLGGKYYMFIKDYYTECVVENIKGSPFIDYDLYNVFIIQW